MDKEITIDKDKMRDAICRAFNSIDWEKELEDEEQQDNKNRKGK